MKMDETKIQWVWVFNGQTNHFPSALFAELHLAESWIQENRLTGVLTAYPLNISVYDWTTQNGYFKPKADHHTTSEFIGNFSSAYQDHEHYYKGLTGAEASKLAEADGANW
jgi:hypothetical protein